MIKMEERTIILYLKYKGTAFFGREELFNEGTILWAGHTILFMVGEDDPDWDELIVVNYTEENSYRNVLEQLEKEQRLSYYKILLVGRYPQAVIDRVNKMSYKESSVDTTKGEDFSGNEESGDINPTKKQFELLSALFLT